LHHLVSSNYSGDDDGSDKGKRLGDKKATSTVISVICIILATGDWNWVTGRRVIRLP